MRQLYYRSQPIYSNPKWHILFDDNIVGKGEDVKTIRLDQTMTKISGKNAEIIRRDSKLLTTSQRV